VEEALGWLTAFDYAQVNEDEMTQLGPRPLELATRALANGTRSVIVTMGERGAAYFAATDSGLVKTARIAPEGGPVEGDPTGCGDVFGATCVASLLKGMTVEASIEAANRMARRNVTYRGATGLQRHLVGAIQKVTL
jgi:sugar/nucleoside kinase (ribokinase family)